MATFYVVVGCFAIEILEVFFRLLEISARAGRIAVLVMVGGFPVALIFARAYEITPEGPKLTGVIVTHHSICHHIGKRLDRAIIVLLTSTLAYFITHKLWLSKRVTQASDLATGAGYFRSVYFPKSRRLQIAGPQTTLKEGIQDEE